MEYKPEGLPLLLEDQAEERGGKEGEWGPGVNTKRK